MPMLSTNIRRSIAGFLGLALLAALWTTSLARISDKPTAVSLLTDAGTQLVNPLLVSNGSGITLSTYQQLERDAAAHPNQAVQILFIKPVILGRDIAGKSYPQALQVIFGKVAEAYYAGGPGAAFSLPSQLQSVVGTYTPFTQMKTSLPGIPQSPLPQLPSFATNLFAHVGFTPTTLTADGHSAVVTLSLWLWLASGVLGALLALFGAGWARLSTIAWSVFHSSWHITLLLIIAAFLVSRNPTQAAPYRGVLGLVGSAFFPIYGIAAVAGLCGGILCFVVTHLPGRQAKTAPDARAQAMPAMARHLPPEAAAYLAGQFPPGAPASTPGYSPAGAPSYIEPGHGERMAAPPPQPPYPAFPESAPPPPDEGTTMRQP